MINELAHRKGKRARVSFRLNPKVHAKTHKFISTGNKTHKFGLLQEDVLKALKNSKYWTSTNLVGLSIHIGSQLTNLKATKKALKVLCETAKKCGQDLEFLDVGGGLGINYDPKSKPANINEYMQFIYSTLKKYFPERIPKVVFEPGRVIAARSGAFVTKVIRNKVSEGQRFLIVDGGMNDFVRPSLYNAYHEIFPSKEVTKKTKLIATDVVGPVCETTDFFGNQRKLPPLKANEFLVIADTGAYGQTMASNYNLRVRSAEIVITKNNDVKLVTPQEQYEHLR